jgi:predicted nucleic acid-binding protein
MILVDSSVWIEHFRKGGPLLRDLLSEGVVITHPFVVGELACGNLTHRMSILSDLNALPIAISATHDEVLRLVEDRKLWDQGVGWIDAHLMASALISKCRFWTLDRRLHRSAGEAGVSLYRNT